MVEPARERSRLLWWVLLSLYIFALCPCPHLVQGQVEAFPIGLVVEYDVQTYSFRGTQRFEVLDWATGPGQSLATVRVTETTDSGSTTATVVVDFTSWNASFLLPPILVDVSTWQAGQTVTVPSRSHMFELSGLMMRVQEGTYSCWWANYFSFDEQTWQADGEAMAYETALGVLVYWGDQHGSYLYGTVDESSASLRSSNMAQFGRLTAESLLLLGLLAVLILVATGGVLLYIRRLRHAWLPSVQPSSAERMRSQPGPEAGGTLGEEPRLAETLSTPPMADGVSGCVVCGYNLAPEEAILRCPHCGARAHRSHFLEWAKIKRNCPKCHEVLEATDLAKGRSSGRRARGSRKSVPTS